jgi:hypothetical protein
MRPTTLTISLAGTDGETSSVDLADLGHLCGTLVMCLRRMEKKFASIDRSLSYRIIEVQNGSVELKVVPRSHGQYQPVGKEVIDLFTETIRRIKKNQKLDYRINENDLAAFKKLLFNPRHERRVVKVNRMVLDSRFAKNIRDLINLPCKSFGTVKGKVERLNLHNCREFTLFPVFGEPIKCSFEERLFETVKIALRQSATVTGEMYRFHHNLFPTQAIVHKIEIHPPDHELPRLSEYCGAWSDDPTAQDSQVNR